MTDPNSLHCSHVFLGETHTSGEYNKKDEASVRNIHICMIKVT